MMRRGFQSTAVRPYTAAAAAGILTLGLVTAPPTVALPRTEAHAVELMAVTAIDISPVAPLPTSAPRPAAASQTANDTTSPPDFLAFAASILEYLNSLGLGAGPGLAAIGLSGLVVAFAATAYAWNGFADLVNPVLRVFHIPRVPKFPVCFAGQQCGSTAPAQTRVARLAKPAGSLVKPTGRGVATSKRAAANDKNNTAAAKARPTKKSTSSASPGSGTGRSAR